MQQVTFNVKNLQKWATIIGGSFVAGNAVMGLMKVKTIKGALMPVVSLLVGVSAVQYALNK